MVQTTAKRTNRLRLFAQILLLSYSQTKLDMESHRRIVSKLITTFSSSQMNNAELALTLSWREDALFEEREKNVFVKPKEQRRTCSSIAMARKRTFRGTRKERTTRSPLHLSFC